MKQNKQEKKQYSSSCCNAALFTHTGDEGTSYYECAKCHKPCDAVSEQSRVSKGGIHKSDFSPAKPIQDKGEWGTSLQERETDWEKIISGIDKTETEDGWWETSTGAEFGERKKKEIETYISKVAEQTRKETAQDIFDDINKIKAYKRNWHYWYDADDINTLAVKIKKLCLDKKETK